MTDVAVDLPAPSPPRSRARTALIKRLADVVSLPASRVNAFERAMTADLLVEMLREGTVDERLRVSRRVSGLGEIPNALVRLFARDHPTVSTPFLSECASLSDADLVSAARDGETEHRRAIAHRRDISEIVTETLTERLEPVVLEPLLRNMNARLSQPAVEAIVAASRADPGLIPLLLKRPELRPSHAYVMFWWADADGRRQVLSRFAVSREVLQEAAADVFPVMAEERWNDPLARKALQFIERRQRNRAALQRSPYESLEAAIAATERGLNNELVSEIAYLAGLKPATGAKIMADPGGEPIAVICKATGLSKGNLRILWRAMRRPETTAEGDIHPALERVLNTYDMMAVDRAQTVLRYWNWALSSALTPALVRAIRAGDEDALDEYSVPQRAAMLALADDLVR
jgi:uncharacterized protein (DUF2336 family)